MTLQTWAWANVACYNDVLVPCSQKGRESSMFVAILPVSYSIFSALLGTQSVLFSKSLSVLLRTTVSGDSQVHEMLRVCTMVKVVTEGWSSWR